MRRNLNRSKLRRMIIAEAKKALSEMGMGGMGGHMGHMSAGGAPPEGSMEYEYTAEIIQRCIMSCIHAGRCDMSRVQMMCQEMCEDYGCPQYADYCAQRVSMACQRMGLL